ncbi:hypothetical protein 8014-B2_00125 [Lactobacillus phage ATCC 8014-B2]|uniref:Uncharacterized protein n=1 Tax=Lactobacillus phage ATCC 8014-B2 TaxID=1225795 RepID=K4I254_9CAUD|nr:hypothetical protein HOQ89_gp021 [Lactobacillus phage ATCC 8014-B2]AFU63192.1 hypothetical protein 8014-B2_00125 [Lactobacillus phage ATCC 8014-B2]
MTANKKFQELLNNGELTDEQQELAYQYGVIDVNSLYEYLTDTLSSESFEDSGRVIELLNELLKHDSNDYVLYDDDKISELDYDTIEDILN